MRNRFACAAVLLTLATASIASRAADGSVLTLPPGAKVAIVMFEDLQCPDCARAYPLVWEAAKAHHIPVVLHDFPLPRHNWSFKAAIFARYFDTKSETLGNDYRGYIYQNQNMILDEAGLEHYTQDFADKHQVELPFAIDPENKLATKVRADYDLGQKIGLEHTPTIFVIAAGGASSTPFVEVVDRGQLSQIIEDMQKKAVLAAPSKTAGKKKKKKSI